MEWLTDPEALIALATLTALEIVLGIDNIVFISILAGKLPLEQQNKARIIGLALALIGRIVLLLSLTWVMGLTKPLITLLGYELSGRDLILIGGGLFLLAKATHEIHAKLEHAGEDRETKATATFGAVIFQILIIDIVFSLDSVITAVGMARQLWVMVTAVVVAVIIMMVSAGAIATFIEKRPTVTMLALSFLLMVGVALVAEGLEFHIPRGYIYFAMAFSVFVEMLNLRLRKTDATPIKLGTQLPPGVRK